MKKLPLIALLLGIAFWSAFFLLFRDDAEVVLSTDIERYAVQPEGSEESFGILLEAFREEAPYLDWPDGFRCCDEEDRSVLVLEYADLIRENHSVAKGVLRKLSALDRYGAIGDTSNGFGDEILEFSSIRDLTRAVCLYTELCYLEGSEERSLDELLQVHSIMSKLLPHTRHLVHSMIGTVMLNQVRDTMLRVAPYLEADEVQRVLVAYASSPDYPRSIENALYSEYCMWAAELDGIVAAGNSVLAYLLFKRNETLNVYGRFLEAQIASSRAQDWEAMSNRSAALDDECERLHLANRGGWLFLSMAVPAFNSVFKNAYEAKAEDLELIMELQRTVDANQ